MLSLLLVGLSTAVFPCHAPYSKGKWKMAKQSDRKETDEEDQKKITSLFEKFDPLSPQKRLKVMS